MKSNYIRETVMKVIFFIAACASIFAVILICVFLFANGIPAMGEIGFFKFLLGTEWRPSNDIYGILPMILGSIYVTAGAIVIGVPIALLTAIFLAYFCPKKIYKFCKSGINLMAGIPSVVYGFFGLVLMVPMIKSIFNIRSGSTMLTAAILLAIMVLPTIVGVTEASLESVPQSYYEGALALGATHSQSVFFTMVPAAKSGIVTGVVLGIGRVIGETMAVIMVAGNQAVMPEGLLSGVRTMTANIVLEMGYASGLHREALIATGVVLFVFILIINLIVAALKKGAIQHGD
ncbi:phosphate transport system permease protein [Catenibacillus scindens]|uniref:Phosphate transport system permease protein n=1 Tax=Catenibacillus scindens TaxID=673271 RepID=A0A7W8H7J0_9FIRM|nr:phosphate ABC transporter permease subunit PstC [Catenibacillus scindens]MBB5263173.1 phosphate transport system permease protein [Catenibacillus scindens]